MEIFKKIPMIPYEGPNSKNALAFKYYNADKIILGKPMKEHLPFAMPGGTTFALPGRICLAGIRQTNLLGQRRVRWLMRKQR